MDHFRALEVFSTAALEGSFIGVSRKLGMSPASVTRAITHLEKRLGTTLFVRTTRAIALTEAGISYLESAEKILEAIRVADDAVQGRTAMPHGLLRVSAPVMFGRSFIAPIIGEFLGRYPEAQVSAIFVDRHVSLTENEADVAVRIGPLNDSSLVAVRVGTLRQAISGAPSYFKRRGVPTHPNQMIDHDIINYVGPGFSPIRWSFDNDIDIPITARLSFSDMAASIKMGCQGYGLVRSLNYQVAAELEAGLLQTVLDEYCTNEWPIHIVYPKQLGQAAKLRSFVDLAKSRLLENKFLRR